MESLKIQDEFSPYYAKRNGAAALKAKSNGKSDWHSASTADVRARLEACRDKLARAIAATKADRP